MISDIMTIKNSQFPFIGPFDHTSGRNIKCGFYSVFVEQGNSGIYLGKTGIVESETQSHFFTFGPGKLLLCICLIVTAISLTKTGTGDKT